MIGQEYGSGGILTYYRDNSQHISSFVPGFPHVHALNLAILPQQKLLFINEKHINHYFSELQLEIWGSKP